jgi:hypothetical protein
VNARKFKLTCFTLTLLLSILACGIPSGVDHIAETSIALTVAAQPQISSEQLPNTPVPPPDNSEPVQPTTAPTDTLTPTLSTTKVKVGVNTNCRLGPGVPYDYLGNLSVGGEAEVVGQGPYGNYVIIPVPGGSGLCWLWLQYATIDGSLANVPVFTPPPSPTPTFTPTPVGPGFILEFVGIAHCSPGDDYANFKVVNNGSVTFESALMDIQDLDTSTGLYIGFNNVPFKGSSPGCGPAGEKFDPGDTAYIAYYVGTPAPSGHSAKATMKMCTQNGLLGDCVSVSINFTLP